MPTLDSLKRWCYRRLKASSTATPSNISRSADDADSPGVSAAEHRWRSLPQRHRPPPLHKLAVLDESGDLLEGAAAQAGTRLPPIAQAPDPQAQITGGQPETRENDALIKKENKIFLLYKELQKGAVAKSYI
jgi:hypothetical protein